MSDNFASLRSSLLARKGGAKPAMRRQTAIAANSVSAAQNLEDLGWNDMGQHAEEETPVSPLRKDVLQLTPAQAGSDDEAAEYEEQWAENSATAPLVAPPGLAQKPNVVLQQEEIAERIEAASAADVVQAHHKERKLRSALERGKRSAFTLRLDGDRHLKLRLACTLRKCSAQRLVVEALDQFLGQIHDLDTLAAHVRGFD